MAHFTVIQVDAFTNVPFAGNPAAVVPMAGWPADDLLQAIAAEMNLSETAFVVKEGDAWRIRWFTPTVEVDLCGHATLAAAWVILSHITPQEDVVSFIGQAGPLHVSRAGEGLLAMDFPRWPVEPVKPAPKGLAKALGVKPLEIHRQRDLICVLADAAAVEELAPDLPALKALAAGVVVTAAVGAGTDIDFVSRYFAPHHGIDEDPVTGSTHCMLVPFWAERLGKTALVAEQVSARGGRLYCQDTGERVVIAGHVTPIMEGRLLLPG